MSAAINSRPSRIMGILTAVLCCLFIAVTPVKALAAPAEGATVQYSGTSGTVTWEIYTDGTMVLRPTSGDEGTMDNYNVSHNYPWSSYKSSVKCVETWGTIHLGNDASWMFHDLTNCTKMDISGLDTRNVTTVERMFCNCRRLTSLDLSRFNTSNVTNMNLMFYDCRGLTSLNLDGFDTSNVTNMNQMFYDCKSLTTIDVSGFDTGNVINMTSMFSGCSGLTSLDVSGFDTGNVTGMASMFNGCSGLTSIDVSGFETGMVTSMGGMFYKCSGLSTIDVSGFDTSDVTGMPSMFSGCSSLTSLDVSGFETGNVTNMSNMFNGCRSLTSLNVSGFDTGNATSMSSMFSDCRSLTSLDVSGFDTGNVTNMNYMFYRCSGLTSLDVSGFDTSKVTNMGRMFEDCSGLTSLDLGGFDTKNVTDMGRMFFGCSFSEVTIGENFRFKGKNITQLSKCASLPTPSGNAYTLKWVKEDGTVDAKTPEELRDQYDANAAAWAGKWVWEEKPTKYTVKFNPPAGGGYAGSMPDQKIKAAEAGTLNANEFSRFDYSFDHWDGSDGRTYTDGQTIPANTFNVGDTLTLTAVFTKDQHVLSFIDGVAEFTLKAGEKAVFSDLPGGSKYQIWEETPSGWQLIDQTNAAGTVVPNQTTDASFTNEYVPGTATFTLMAQKTLDGMLPGDGQFEFELIDSDNTVVQTVSNNAAGIVQFDQIVFRQPGTYVYQIREVRGDDPGISYDAHTEVVTITVSDDGHGNLTATSSSMTTLPSFENETKPGMLTVEKKVQGGSSDQVFNFEIELTNDKGMPLSNVHVVGGQ